MSETPIPGVRYYCDPSTGAWRSPGRPDLAFDPEAQPAVTTNPGAAPLGTDAYPVPTGAVFVATTGNDTTGTGTQAAPYATLTKAVAAAAGGDTIVLRAGVYTDGGDTQTQVGTFGLQVTKSLTIQNYPGEVVWFDGSRAATAWTLSGGVWSTPYNRVMDRSPTNVRGASDTGGANFTWTNSAYPLAPWPDMVLRDGVKLTPVSTKAALGPGKFWVEGANTGSSYWFAATRLWVGDDPTGHDMRVSDKVTFIYLHATGCTLRGIGVRRYSNSNPDKGVILSDRDNNVIENMWVEDTGDDAITFAGGFNQTIRQCTIRRTGAIGVVARNADGMLLDGLDVQYANDHHWNTSPQAGGMKITATQGVTIRGSLIANMIGSKGFWLDQTCDSINVLTTTFRNIPDYGIKMEVSSKGIIAGCLFDNVATPMQINNTDQVRVWNNTLVGFTGRGATWDQDSRRANNNVTPFNRDVRQPQSYYDLPENNWQINTLQFCNNVLVRPSSGAAAMFAVDDHERSASAARPLSAYNITARANLYAWVAKPTYPWLYPAVAGGAASVKNYQSLTDVQAQTAFEDVSTFTASDAVVDSALRVTNTALHATADPIPTSIAALLGVAPGTRHLGAFL